ncbi:hypothetical protein KO527_05125 [Pseudoalteromonas sp. C2R02]|uniref:hypothetical protein n=1 Tax=Pseudoalteromonas sp. C2R02 TaxID=2841565 RepID=UPI001C08AED0|nr:hypothetical protein [Pseudoalteromonas sp. C2R02]MBU2968729.1 hypothetical protein [Pseudoalteromonas sp. C2R02]
MKVSDQQLDIEVIEFGLAVKPVKADEMYAIKDSVSREVFNDAFASRKRLLAEHYRQLNASTKKYN